METSKWFSVATSDQIRALELERINDAIAEVIFNQDVAGLPVYLDLRTEEVSAICRILEIDPSEFDKYVCDTVLNTPKTSGWKKVFSEFGVAAKKWVDAGNPLEVPPTLALLAVLSMAAEVMASETDVSGANYYKRLSALLGCDGEETELGNRYRDHAIQLWTPLKDWLGSWEGERGVLTVPIPKTSSQSGRDFKWAIQMPISQARLRDADRQDLHRMFDHYRLDSGLTSVSNFVATQQSKPNRYLLIWGRMMYKSAKFSKLRKDNFDWLIQNYSNQDR